LWNARSGDQLHAFNGYSNQHSSLVAVRSVAFNADGSLLASGSEDRTVVVWDVHQERPLGEPLSGFRRPVRSVAFGPDNETLATGGGDGMVVLWDLYREHRLGQPLVARGHPVRTLAFSPHSDLLASGSDDLITLWDMHNRPSNKTLLEDGDFVRNLAFSPDGSLLASGDSNRVLLWDVAVGRVRRVFTTQDDLGLLDGIAFSPDGRFLASGYSNGAVLIQDTNNGHVVHKFSSPGGLRSLAFSADGNLAWTGKPGKIMLWDIKSNRGPQEVAVGQAAAGRRSLAEAMAFSSDGKYLAIGMNDALGNPNYNAVILWDVRAARRLGEPLLAESRITGVAFSPDSANLVSGTEDGMDMRDIASGQLLGKLSTDDISSLAYSPDGTMLASSTYGESTPIILWNPTLAFWKEQACAVANRNLTPVEWSRFIGGDPSKEPTCTNILIQ
ncbi:MAG: WD40 repeat domain-containing protein, partial [Chloroflexota bacterium]|nr:WD40 repeat domain-containing protein [Chloroflexota bacterium]